MTPKVIFLSEPGPARHGTLHFWSVPLPSLWSWRISPRVGFLICKMDDLIPGSPHGLEGKIGRDNEDTTQALWQRWWSSHTSPFSLSISLSRSFPHKPPVALKCPLPATGLAFFLSLDNGECAPALLSCRLRKVRVVSFF